MKRTVEFRYVVMRNGADYIDLHPTQSSAPQIRMDDSAEIKTSFTGEFVYDERFDLLNDELRPEMILNGVSYPLGVYAPASVTDRKQPELKSMSLECYDRTWRVRDTYTETSLYFAAGTAYVDAIVQLLVACGVTIVVQTPSAATLAEAREDWLVGTSYLEIINGLLSEINYNPLWFNSTGAAVLEPASVPTAANIDHTLNTADVLSLVLPGVERETDVYSAPNVFLCVCSNADKSGPMTATAENTNPQSPLSTVRRGRRIIKVENVNNIASQEELQAYANKLRDESMISGETIRVSTALLPGYGVADVTALHTEELNVICVERAWDMSLTVGGTMQHTLERVVVNIG